MHIFCNAPGPEAYYAIKDSFIRVYESAEGFVHSYVNQTLDLSCTGRRNQTICGFRRNADVGVAALSCYAALRQHWDVRVITLFPHVKMGYCSSPIQRDDYTVVISSWRLLAAGVLS